MREIVEEVEAKGEQWHLMSPEEVLQRLRTTEAGLSSKEVEKRQQRYGKNEITTAGDRISILKILIAQFNALIVILLVATAISAAFGNMIDAAVIFGAVMLCVALGFLFEFRSEKALRALKEMAAPAATVVRAGKELRIASKEIVPGDILVLRAGDRIAADARVIAEENLKVDESALTGESVGVNKRVSMLKEDVMIADRTNMVYSGTTVTYGRGKAVVTATGMRTELGKVASMLAGAKEDETPLKTRLREIGRWLSVSYLIICASLFALGVLTGVPLLRMLLWSISLAVAIVPETLPLIITGTLALGVQRMAKRNAIVRKLPAVETLGCITTICSDKTGTLTKNEMTVRRVYAGGKLMEVTGDELSYACEQSEDLRLALQIAALCNDSHLVKEEEADGYSVSGEPTEAALVVAAEEAGMNKDALEKRFPRVGEIPFERERKRMSTIHLVEGRTVAYVKGAPEVLLELSTGIYRGGEVSRLTDAERREVLEISDKMAAEALRVIAVAYRELSDEGDGEQEQYTAEVVERDLVFVGLFGMSDPPREEVKEAIGECKKAGIKAVMITGDHKLTAVAIAKELGMLSSNRAEEVLTGVELDKMSDEELENRVDSIVVYSRVSPAHKLRIVNALRRKGNVVAMTGDGINDAPALKSSDVGVAMNSGTDVAKEASDMILVDDNFATIVAAIREGRAIYDNMRKYLTYVLSYAFAEVCLLGGAFLFGIFARGMPLFPLTAIQILWTNLVIEDLPAMGLGLEPPERDIMERKPRDPEERVFTGRMIHRLILMSVVISSGCFLIFLSYLQAQADADVDVNKAQTMVFATLIFYEAFNAFNCRSERHSLLRIGIFANKWLILGVMGSLMLMLLAIQMPYTGRFFHTVPLTFIDWCIALATGITVMVAVELWKVLLAHSQKSSAIT
ncbi:MAG: cation-translocating P-type ATPase [Methanophagales archaeon]|nr:cation-translocating P-type ATPase [Methanophagales archaeon]